MISRRVVVYLGLSQLICWGISYYLIGGFGAAIGADFGWTRDVVYGGFSAALLVMGVTSPLVGRLIDRRGGRAVMVAGSAGLALGCLGLALSRDVWTYYASWLWLGFAMRLTLYDAAFAALARIAGPDARRPISQITLLGGLASTTFWPLGHVLGSYLGWRGALVVYAGFALLTIPLHLAIPNDRDNDAPRVATDRNRQPLALTPRDRLIAGVLYAVIMTTVNALNAAMSAHIIGILAGLGLAASASVWIAALRGIGQSLARLCEVQFGGRFDALQLNAAAALTLPFCFAAGLWSGEFSIAAVSFAFFYGAANGIATITRGTLPLLLFDHRTYGVFVGRLLAPSFVLSAVAPVAFAYTIDRFGERSALYLAIAITSVTLVAALILLFKYGRSVRQPAPEGKSDP